MSNPESPNWWVERSLVEADMALMAGVQAAILREERPGYVTEFKPDDRSWDAAQLLVLQVVFSEMPPADREAFSQLIAVSDAAHQRTARITGEYWTPEEQAIYLNFFQPDISTGLHVDTHTDTTAAVGLIGVGEIHIGDRVFFVDPTDALILDDRGPIEARPPHDVKCIGEVPRISLVTATA